MNRITIICIIFCATLYNPCRELLADDAAKEGLVKAAPLQSAAPAEVSPAFSTNELENASARNFRQLHLDLTSARWKAEELVEYTAILEIQEERDEQLKPADRVLVKIRRQPFSVYMRWNESGQEAIFVDGENNNRLLVKPTNALAAFKRVWHLDPDSRLAKQSCRYPITTSGIEKLTVRVQEFYTPSHDWIPAVHCSRCNQTLEKTPVLRYDVKFLNKTVSPDFSLGRYCFDATTGLLIAVENFGWSETQEERLVERYVYREIDVDADLLDVDFDQTNPNYEFAVR